MNFLTKLTLTLSVIFLVTGLKAQDLQRKIPSDALVVATLKGKNMLELMSTNEFNQTFLGKKILDKVSRSAKNKVNQVEELGFNLSADFYYYNQGNDSVSYHCLLAPVKNAGKLDELYTSSGLKFNTAGSWRTYYNQDSTELTRWNENILYFVKGEGKTTYLYPAAQTSIGITDTAMVAADSTIVDTVAVAAAYDTREIQEPAVRKTKATKTKTSGAKKKGKVHSKKHKARPARKKPVQIKEEETDPTEAVAMADSVAAAPAYEIDNSYSEQLAKKKAVIARCVQQKADDFITKGESGSILDNKDYVNSTDQHAEISVWIAGLDRLIGGYMPSNRYFDGKSMFKGYGSVVAKLYLEEKNIKIGTAMHFDQDMADVFKKVNKRKLNKKFLQYVNEDKLIGYMAYAADTKAYLEAYPKIISRFYGSTYGDEIEMASDLFSLLLDEEAVSKVVKGDGLFIFNGLSQKEVSYKSYEYNEENFETKEVTKTKKETLPDFLLMFSSEDHRLINKLIAYGVKKNFVKNDQGYYEMSIPKSPLALFFTLKNDMIFLGTNANEMAQIAGDHYVGKISSRHKKMLNNANYAAYFSSKKLAGKIPAEEFGNTAKVEKANKILTSIGDIYMKSDPIEGNAISGEISMDIPSSQQNALKYLFSLIEEAKK
ncbi:hypothetical protein DBR11_03270 [Pedobacter sp. HMWF019]|uniref:hypothetical protein n=1 Tax=Pedobacter sp. HMWF019 TaxID=2056856 RepID=UPI000D37DCF9|nr:hypothetical protein [Pedobacter sp. HMWF019]PTT03114.1 hypothetical protein DBR11_03270 [Pedobacter sp. HMWF019]